mmetsp:Transcript_56942/g.118040  ORF Transcript_56942/g.118040 Transcript_56942/m.118040 type:complete len:395 (+) Transcript_56942:92-1276(+)
MTVSLPIAREILTDAARAQVQAWDERFGTSPASSQTVNAKAQTEAFAKRDATGVEAVHDVMPTEQQIFEDFLFEAAATSTAPALQVLDFGCGDGRYLQQFLRSAEALRPRGRTLRVVAYEVSAEALRSFHAQALQEGLEKTEGLRKDDIQLVPLLGRNLQLEFVLGSCSMTALEVGEMLRRWEPVFDLAVIGWGALSSIPRLPGLSAEDIMAMLSQLTKNVMNVVSSTNNHVKFQRVFEAMRQAFRETSRPAVQSWLERRIGLASFDRSYYYTVDTKQKMFYSAITADLEAVRLREAGFDDVRIRICNIINFFDIKTKPKAARINAAVIRLLERGDVWGAQLLLSRGVALAFKKPLSSMRVGSSIFDASSEHKLYGQVARYFISTGRSKPPGKT